MKALDIELLEPISVTVTWEKTSLLILILLFEPSTLRRSSCPFGRHISRSRLLPFMLIADKMAPLLPAEMYKLLFEPVRSRLTGGCAAYCCTGMVGVSFEKIWPKTERINPPATVATIPEIIAFFMSYEAEPIEVFRTFQGLEKTFPMVGTFCITAPWRAA